MVLEGPERGPDRYAPNMNAKCQSAVVALIVGMGGCPAAHAVSVGQADIFEDGTTSNWIINASGSAVPPVGTLPVNMATGGPQAPMTTFCNLRPSAAAVLAVG